MSCSVPDNRLVSVSALSSGGPRLEVVITDARQLFDESHDGPDFLVGYFDRAKTRHAGHVDSILDDPKQLLRWALVGDLLEIGRVRMESFRELRPLDAWAAVTTDASPRRKGLRPRLHDRGIIERRRGTVIGVALNRSGADADQGPCDQV